MLARRRLLGFSQSFKDLTLQREGPGGKYLELHISSLQIMKLLRTETGKIKKDAGTFSLPAVGPASNIT